MCAPPGKRKPKPKPSSRSGASTSPSLARPRTRCALSSSIKATWLPTYPIKELGDEAPEYERPWVESKKRPMLAADDIDEPTSYEVCSAQACRRPRTDVSRRWVYEQYDTLIQGKQRRHPGW